MVTGIAASPLGDERASETLVADQTALSAELGNTIFADVKLGVNLIGRYEFSSFEDLNAALVAFVTALESRGVRHSFKPSLILEETLTQV